MSNDARDALRRYLEQRRDLGESELVLDRMSVDEVMSMLVPPTKVRRDLAAPADHPRLYEDAAAPAADVAEPAPAEPAEPAARSADEPAIGDWRTMLRAAGSAPPTEMRPSLPARPEPAAPPAPPAPATPLAPAEPLMPPAEPPVAAPAAVVGDASRWLIPGVDVPTGLVFGGDTSELFAGPMNDLATLTDVAARVATCTRCPLHRTAKNPVPGEGNPNAQLVVVGEAPGAEEDASGRPFVGASGQLLTKILAAISLNREDVFIANVVKHRPPGNRNPEPDEVQACSPYLVRQLELLKPKAILTVGNFAAQTLLGTKLGISKLRGQVHRYHGIPLVATYHPAALLRNPTWKRPTWEDVQLVRRILDRAQ